ncbi:MAG: hypothetical protein V4772_07460 [Pseudomonadota bacterium]
MKSSNVAFGLIDSRPFALVLLIFATLHKLIRVLSSRAFWAILAMTLLCAPLVWAVESNNETKLLVTATVLKHASLQVLAQPGSVILTAVDIARGYVDVSSPAQVAVMSNTQGGYMLMFDSQGEFLRQTLVKGLSTDVQLGASGGGVAQRSSGRGMSKTLIDLGFRFVLSESARQGVYPWPLRLSVTPL